MPEFVITSTDSAGRRATDIYIAETRDAAVEELRQRGHANIELHTGEFEGDTCHSRLAAELGGPDRYLRWRRLSRVRHRALLLVRLVRTLWWYFVPPLAYLLIRLINHHPWRPLDTIVVGIFIAGLMAVLWIVSNRPSKSFHGYLDAMNWGRYDEAGQHLEALKDKISERSRCVFQSKLLAARGHLQTALTNWAAYEHSEGLPQWEYHLHRVEINSYGHAHQSALEDARAAYEEAPSQPLVLVTLATALALTEADYDGAERLLVEAERHPISTAERFGLSAVWGAIACGRGEYAEALEMFTEAVRLLQGEHRTVLTQKVVNEFHMWMVIAYAGLGDAENARKTFRKAAPMLRALQDDVSLPRAEAALRSLNIDPDNC
ncbi:MAG: hypothetical protein GC159_16125 [Phycisphaera sp.]|nr:hypothetical protein [Phycisphaera sp.]